MPRWGLRLWSALSLQGSTVVDQRYRLADRIGQTTTHSVYRAEDTSTGETACLKILERSALERDPETALRLQQEAKLLATIKHPNVLSVRGLGRHNGTVYVSMELVEGGSLEDLLEPGPMAVGDALPLLIQLADGLDLVHTKGIIHGDIKPANVLIDDRGDHPVSKLMDFGLSRLAGASDGGGGGDAGGGTLHYAAPEQVGVLNRPVDGRADLYSVGVMAFQMLAGQLPLDADDPGELTQLIRSGEPTPLRELLPEAPPLLEEIVTKLMAKEPADRYQTAGGLARDLERFLEAYRNNEPKIEFDLDAGSAQHLRLGELFVGRADDLELAAGAMVEAREHELRIVLVSGRSGIGKSAFVRELENRSAVRGWQFMRGKCYEFENTLPYYSMSEALTDYHGAVQRMPAARRGQQLEALKEALGDLAGEVTSLAPVWRDILGDAKPSEYLGEGKDRERFYTVMSSFLRAASSVDYPVLLFLDDLQWADLSTIQLLVALVEQLHDCPLVVLGTYRSEEVGPDHPLQELITRATRDDKKVIVGGDRLLEVKLGPFQREETEELIDAAVGDSPAPLVDAVHERSEGNPLFVVEILKALAHHGILKLGGGGEDSIASLDVDAIANVELPTTVLGIVLKRIQLLDPAVQKVLQIAALVGKAFTFDMLCRVSERPADEIFERLDAGLQEQLIVEASREGGVSGGERTYAFYHDKIQEALHEQVAAEQRPGIHRRIGEYLLAKAGGQSGEELGDLVYELAHHFGNGDNPDLAFEYCRKAGERAQSRHANEQAVVYYRTAIDLLDESRVQATLEERADLSQRMGSVLDLQGEYTEAIGYYRKAIEATADNVEGARLLGRVAYSLQKSGGYDESRETVLEALRKLGIILRLKGVGLYYGLQSAKLRYRMAASKWAKAESFKTATDKEKLVAELLTRLWYFYGINDVEKMFYLVYELLARVIPFGPSEELSDAYRIFAISLCQAKSPDFEEALQSTFKAIEIARNLKLKMKLAQAQCYAGVVLQWEAESAQAIDYLNTARHMLSSIGNQWDLVNAHIFSWMAHKNLGELDDALQHAMSIIQIAEGIGAWGSLSSGYQKAGETLILKGELTKGEEYFQRGMDIAKEKKLSFDGYMSSKIKGQLLIRDEEYAEAREYLEKSIEINEREDTAFLRAYITDAYMSWCEAVLRDRSWLFRLDPFEREALLSRVEQYVNNGVSTEQRLLNHLGQAYATQGLLMDLRGKPRKAKEAFRRANEVLVDQQRPLDRARVLMMMAECEEASLETSPLELLRDAKALVLSCDAQGEVNRANLLMSRLGHDEEAAGRRFDEHGRLEVIELERKFKSLIRLNRMLSEILDEREILQRIVDLSIELTGAERGFLIQRTEDGERTIRVARDNEGVDIPESEHNISWGVVEHCEKESEGLVITDAAQDDRFKSRESVHAFNLRSIVASPLIHKELRLGVLYVDNRLIRQLFTERDVELLGTFAAQAAISLVNAQAFDTIRDLNVNLEGKVEERTRALRQAQQALVQSEKMASLGQLVAGVAHELNNPTNFIYGNMQFLSEHADSLLKLVEEVNELHPEGSPERAKVAAIIEDLDIDYIKDDLPELVQGIREGASRVKTIVENLRTFSRSTGGAPIEFQLRDGVEKTLSMMGGKARQSVEITTHFEDTPAVLVEPNRLNQVILNLVMNAIQAVKEMEKQRVDINVKCQEDEVILQVADTGPGVPAEIRTRIFDPFFTTKDVGEGTGLGLSISYGIIQDFGGTIAVGDAPDGGASFEIRLPTAERSHELRGQKG